jgi:uncharacterized protein (DUF58 family)
MSVQQHSGRTHRAVPWLGLAAIIGGLTLIELYFDHPRLASDPNPFIAVVYLGTGCVLTIWGLRAVVGEMVAFIFKRRERPAQRYRVRVPPEALIYGLILAVLCAGALVGQNNLLMLVFGLTAGPFILNGQMTLAILKRLRVSRRLPEHASAGENFSVTLSLENRKRFLSSWMIVAEDQLRSPGEKLQPAILFACVPARSEREASYKIRPASRGLYEFGPVRVLSRFPLGLMERSYELGAVESLVVYPRIGRLKPLWRKGADAGEPTTEQSVARLGASDDEFHRLREYRAGDNPRAIHWRTTARRSQLMVREFQNNRRHDLFLVVDLWLPEKALSRDHERVELAVSLAASICVDQTQSAVDSGLELLICGEKTWLGAGPAGARSIGELLERLALAEAGPAAGLAVALESAPMTPVRKVLITTRPAEAARGAIEAKSRSAKGDAADGFEVIHAVPEVLIEYLAFDEGADLIRGPE